MEGPHGEKLSENAVGMKSQPKNFLKRKLAVKEHIIQSRSKKNQWGYLPCEGTQFPKGSSPSNKRQDYLVVRRLAVEPNCLGGNPQLHH